MSNQQGPWHQLAQQLIQTHGQDMSRVLVIVPEHFQHSTLRHALQEFNTAFFLPRIETLQSLSALYQSTSSPLNRQQSILLLANELQQYRSLFGKGSRWGLASDLYRLFSDLTRQQVTLNSESDILSLVEQTDEDTFEWLSKESKLVLTLWKAWHTQLDATGLKDPDLSYIQGLEGFLEHMPVDAIYWLESVAPDACELSWWQACQARAVCHQVSIPDNSNASDDFNCSYQPCNSAENQALTVLAAIQRQLHHDKGRQIEVVTNDRKLVRRLQALLVRFDIIGDDKSGWGLSTTQAAACVEHWLNCIDQDFHYQAFLDFLKSPFSFPDITDKNRLIYILEQDLVHRENIASNLDRFKQALTSRNQRLNLPFGDDEKALLDLLERCRTYAEAFEKYQYKLHDCKDLTNALNTSLDRLGISLALDNDAAGALVKELLLEVPAIDELKMHWADFRQWINLQLEQTSFRPSVSQSHVVFLNHTQALWGSNDHAFRILCGMSPQHFPPRKTPVPFFGEAIRTQLGLQLSHCNDDIFERYLHSQLKSQSLILWQSAQDDDPLPPANGIEKILPQLSANYDHDLTQWLPSSNVASNNTYRQPAPLAEGLLKKTDAVTAQQRLINCPYLYFTHDLLGLGALDEISEALQKSDYGSRVHLCLEAFHHRVDGLPPPFLETLSEYTKDAATKQLIKISEAVFARDITQHFEHQSWFSRWKRMIPSYIDWEIKRRANWQPHAFEKNIKTSYPLRGRIDRLDKDHDAIGLIDYKTGMPPSKADILSGEDIQLSTYAFAVEHVSKISYLSLGSGDKTREVSVEKEELSELVPEVEARYRALRMSLERGEKLPAWGEQETCQRCHNSGICRRALWVET